MDHLGVCFSQRKDRDDMIEKLRPMNASLGSKGVYVTLEGAHITSEWWTLDLTSSTLISNRLYSCQSDLCKNNMIMRILWWETSCEALLLPTKYRLFCTWGILTTHFFTLCSGYTQILFLTFTLFPLLFLLHTLTPWHISHFLEQGTYLPSCE